MSTVPGWAVLAPVPSRRAGCEPLLGCGGAEAPAAGGHGWLSVAGSSWHAPRDPPARCGLRELRQGSMRRVRQYSFMENRFLAETRFTFDEISHYLIKVLPEAFGTWTSLSHPPEPRGASLAQPAGFGAAACPQAGCTAPRRGACLWAAPRRWHLLALLPSS